MEKLMLDTSQAFKDTHLVVRIKHTRSTRFRFWLAGWLLVAVAKLVGSASANLADCFCSCGKCGHACAYVEPYGFVPEAGCSVHDADDDDDRTLA